MNLEFCLHGPLPGESQILEALPEKDPSFWKSCLWPVAAFVMPD